MIVVFVVGVGRWTTLDHPTLYDTQQFDLPILVGGCSTHHFTIVFKIFQVARWIQYLYCLGAITALVAKYFQNLELEHNLAM